MSTVEMSTSSVLASDRDTAGRLSCLAAAVETTVPFALCEISGDIGAEITAVWRPTSSH
jgi:hypothetical protein